MPEEAWAGNAVLEALNSSTFCLFCTWFLVLFLFSTSSLKAHHALQSASHLSRKPMDLCVLAVLEPMEEVTSVVGSSLVGKIVQPLVSPW